MYIHVCFTPSYTVMYKGSFRCRCESVHTIQIETFYTLHSSRLSSVFLAWQCTHSFCIPRPNLIKIYGTLYKEPCALVVDVIDDLPQFGKLKDILVVDEEVYLHVQLLKTKKYSEHFHAYVTEQDSSFKTMKHFDMQCHLPLHLRHVTWIN